MTERPKPCASYAERIELKLDGVLSDVESRDVEAHLQQCEACRGWESDVRKLSALAKSNPRIVTPDGFEERLRSRLGDVRSIPTPWFPSLRYVAAAACIVLVTSFLLLWNRQHPASSVTGPEQGTGETTPQIVMKTEDGGREVIKLPPQIQIDPVSVESSYAYLVQTSH